jgi:hypothetical protein
VNGFFKNIAGAVDLINHNFLLSLAMQSETQKFRPDMNIAFWQNFKKQNYLIL